MNPNQNSIASGTPGLDPHGTSSATPARHPAKVISHQMNSPFFTGAKILAIQLLFATTFFLSAWLKWSQGVPDWFLKQFGPTWLAHAPGGLAAAHYFLAVLETIGFLGCAASIARGEFLAKKKPLLQWTLTFSLFVFVVLAYGSRLTAKYDVAAFNFMYFVGALICLAEVARTDAAARE